MKTAKSKIIFSCSALVACVMIVFSGCLMQNTAQVIDSEYWGNFSSSEVFESKYARLGSNTVSYVEYSVSDKNVKHYGVWFPTSLKTGSASFPLVLVVNGSNTRSSTYTDFFVHLASWGFIVCGNDDPQTGTDDTTSAMLDYNFR